MIARMTEVADAEGLEFHLDEALSSNTVDAHRLLHLALEEGGPRLQNALKEQLLLAYFTRTENVADPDVLRKVTADTGLDPARVDDVLGSTAYLDHVQGDVAQAQAYGISGVPFFVVDGKYGISGAQPPEVIGQVLEQAWSESNPGLTMVEDGDADAACGPEGCQT